MREMGEVNGLTIEEAVPLSTHVHVEETDPDFDTPIWVHQNIIRLSKEFGLDFKGCEKEALELFMKIDRKRQINREGSSSLLPDTPKKKISKELKSLDIGSNFKSNGTRSKGGITLIQN